MTRASDRSPDGSAFGTGLLFPGVELDSAGGEWTAPASLAAEGLQVPPAGESRFAVSGAGETIAVWSSGGAVGEEEAVQASTKPVRQPWSEPTKLFAAPPAPTFGAPDLQVAVAPNVSR